MYTTARPAVILLAFTFIFPTTLSAGDSSSPALTPGPSAFGTLPEEIEEAARLSKLAADLRRQGKSAEAERLYGQALERNAANADALSGMGSIAKNAGRMDEAIDYWKRAVAADPRAAEALDGLTTAYLDAKDYDSAAGYARMLVSADPNNPQARVLLEKAQSLSTAATKSVPPAPAIPADLILATNKLSLHILARPSDFSPADANALMHDSSLTPRNGQFIWLDAGSASVQGALHHERGAVLAFGQPPKAIPADGSWAIAGLTADRDALGRPCLTIKVDPRGARLLNVITRENIGRQMAIVIGNRVVSAPVIQSAINDTAQITGSFTDADIRQMLRALVPQRPITVEARIFQLGSPTALPAFLHTLPDLGYISANEPFRGNIMLSTAQTARLLEWLPSQPDATQLAAPRLTVNNGETAELAIGSPNAAGTGAEAVPSPGIRFVLTPYLLKGNRIWMHVDYSAVTPARSTGTAESGQMMNAVSVSTVVTLDPDQQMLMTAGSDSSFMLLKVSLAKGPTAE